MDDGRELDNRREREEMEMFHVWDEARTRQQKNGL